FDIDLCGEVARNFGAIRYQQEIKASAVVREFRVLRTCLWDTVCENEVIDPADLLVAQTRAEAIFDEVTASAVDSLIDKLKLDSAEYDPLTCLYSRSLFH